MIKKLLAALAVTATAMFALVALPASPASAVNDVQKPLTCTYDNAGVTRINDADFIVATYTTAQVWLRVLLSDPMPNRQWWVQFKRINPTSVIASRTLWGSFDWITTAAQNPGSDTFQVVAVNYNGTVRCSATITGTW